MMTTTMKRKRKASPVRLVRRGHKTCAEIGLTRGCKVIVDAADWQRVAQRYGRAWHALTDGNGRLYAATDTRMGDGEWRAITLGRAVLDAKPGERVEYVNNDRMDCRRSNLRLVGREPAAKKRRVYATQRGAA